MDKSKFSNEKLKSISKKLEPVIPAVDNPSDTFTQFMTLYNQQKEYFSKFQPSDLIKITIYIWSIRETGATDYGDEILENIFFVGFIEPSGEKATKDCDYCDGNGEMTCEYCNDGQVDCDECSGDGQRVCNDCDGTGEVAGEGEDMEVCDICSGEGEVECDECGGDGSVRCPECGGSGRETCHECDGDGYEETDEDIFWDLQVAFWNKNIMERCELAMNTLEPAFTIDDYAQLPEKERMTISNREEQHEYRFDLERGDFYCYSIDDSPNLSVSFRRNLVAFEPKRNKSYFK